MDVFNVGIGIDTIDTSLKVIAALILILRYYTRAFSEATAPTLGSAY